MEACGTSTFWTTNVPLNNGEARLVHKPLVLGQHSLKLYYRYLFHPSKLALCAFPLLFLCVCVCARSLAPFFPQGRYHIIALPMSSEVHTSYIHVRLKCEVFFLHLSRHTVLCGLFLALSREPCPPSTQIQQYLGKKMSQHTATSHPCVISITRVPPCVRLRQG